MALGPKANCNRTPAVVFVDNGAWDCFFELAAGVRRAGIRTIRVSIGQQEEAAPRLLFNRSISLSSLSDLDYLSDVLQNEYVADSQPVETLAAATYAALDQLPGPQRSDLWTGRSAVLDKWDVANALRAAGLLAPHTLAADSTTPSEAVEQFSVPIVLKRRVGAAGDEVQIAHSLQELDQLVAKIDTLHDWFFEQFIEGRGLGCASFVGKQGADLLATFEIAKRKSPLGPASGYRFINDSKLVDTGKQLIDALDIRGFVDFDVIQDANGQLWIHDVNPRVFGGFSICQYMGFDFLGAYARCLFGQDPIHQKQPNTSGVTGFKFPAGWKDILRSEPRPFAWLRLWRWVLRYWRVFGSRYFVFIALRHAGFARQRFSKRLSSWLHTSLGAAEHDSALGRWQ